MESLEEQAEALGIDLGAVSRKPRDYEVWPEHEDAVLMFLRCQTQWRSGGSGVIGLDYSVVLAMMSLYDVANTRQAMEDLQVMEGRARELINQAASSESKPRR